MHELLVNTEHVAYWFDMPGNQKKRTEIQTVTGTDSALLAFWHKQQDLARECGVKIGERDD